MITQEILDYISQQQAAGITREQISQALTAGGWPLADVNEAFSAIINPTYLPTVMPSAPVQLIANDPEPAALPRSNKMFLVAGAVVILLFVLGSSALALSRMRLFTTPADSQTETEEPVAVVPVVKNSVEFEKSFEISANENAKPRGFITGSIDGKAFWVVNGKLAHTVTYFGPNNTNTAELYYDGKKVDIHDGATNYSVTNDFISGVPEITDKLSYYTFNLDKFFFGDEVYPKEGVIFDARSINGKLALRSQSGFTYDGQTVEAAPDKMGMLFSVGGKLVTVKANGNSNSGTDSELIWDGKPYATGAYISEVVDFQGMPAYIESDSAGRSSKGVVVFKGQKVSKEYPHIFNLKVIGGKLAFLAQKNTVDPDVPHYEQEPLYVLVWGGKEYGTEYDSVVGYIDSAGVPAYIAANNVHQQDQNVPSRRYLLRGNEVLFTAKPGEETIWQERELADVDGNPAIIVRTPMTDSLYVFYAGKKFFEGYSIYYVRNVGGKLAVLAEKDRVQYIFMEK